jgi:hypothetical protein
MIEELEIDIDGTGIDGAMFKIKGMGQKVVAVANPTVPAIVSPLSAPVARTDAWLDIASAFGTTSITARILKAKHKIDTGVTYKYGPVGAEGVNGNTFRGVGRGKTFMESEYEIEFGLGTPSEDDLTKYLNGAAVKLRTQLNTAALIGATQRGFLRVDTYGVMEDWKWGELEGTNRTATFKVESQYEAVLGADYVISVQNTTAVA